MRALDSSVIISFMVAWVALGIGSSLYIRSRPTAAEKRRVHRILVVVSAVAFVAFVVFTFPQAFFMAPAIAVITWMNLRNTHFCDQCGRMTQARPFQRTEFCPRYGAPLRAAGRG